MQASVVSAAQDSPTGSVALCPGSSCRRTPQDGGRLQVQHGVQQERAGRQRSGPGSGGSPGHLVFPALRRDASHWNFPPMLCTLNRQPELLQAAGPRNLASLPRGGVVTGSLAFPRDRAQAEAAGDQGRESAGLESCLLNLSPGTLGLAEWWTSGWHLQAWTFSLEALRRLGAGADSCAEDKPVNMTSLCPGILWACVP